MIRTGGKTPHCAFSVDETTINRSMYPMLYSNLDVSEMFVDRQSQRSSMHSRHLNEQLVRVLKTIGYDVGFQKGQGQYLYDRDGVRYGALSLTDDPNFRGGFDPLLPGCTSIPFNDLAALEQALSSREVAAFMVEPIQGKGVNLPTDEFLPGAAALCRKYGTLMVADEIQTGIGRTGRFLAVEHWNVEPDMVLLAKALSGGHVPVGALLTRRSVFDKIFNQMDRAVVHGSTFAKNDLAMAAGIATLEVIESEKLVEAAAKRGAELRLALTRMVPGYELMKEVRGKGLMIGVEFGPPKSLRLKASWNLLKTANKGLFCQLITVPLFKDHKILTQVSGHGSHTIKLLPPLTITEEDCRWIETAFDSVIAASHKVPGAIWSLGKTLVDNAVRKSA